MSENVAAITAKRIQTSWFNVVMSMKCARKKGSKTAVSAHAAATKEITRRTSKADSDKKTHAVTEAFPDAFRGATDHFELLLQTAQFLKPITGF